MARLLRIILVTLPLTNSVTLPVGFPLKIYEGVGLVALGSFVLSGNLKLGRHQKIPLLWVVFFFGSLVPASWGIYELMDMDLSMLDWAHGRYHPLINTLFHFFYLAFDIGLLALFIHALGNGLLTVRDFCKFWSIGALLAVGYGVLLNLFIQAGLPVQLLLRWDEVQFMNLAGFNVARTGPFEEGNYFGFYLLASLVVTLWSLRHWPDRFFKWMLPVLAVGVVMTASPAALMGMLALGFVAVMLGGTSQGIRLGALFAGVIILAVMVQTGLFQTVILDKFSLIFVGGVTDVTNVSLIQRMNESYHAWLMFLDHPFGVGMGNYGYFFGQYDDLFVWLISDFASFKRIANNIYLEVLCEHGFLLFGLFLFILGFMVKRLFHSREILMAVGVILLCGYFLAFPTFRLTLIWVFWSLAVFLGQDQPADQDSGLPHAR